MDLETIARSWDELLEGDLVHLERSPGRRPKFAELATPLPGLLEERLAQRGIDQLYRHQVRSIDAIRAGRHTVISAGTASGKSLCFQVPVAESLVNDAKATALLIYPTKALAQDQLRSWRELRIPSLIADTYDGDTPQDRRSMIRKQSNVILTNPDMLHHGILPRHASWADFFLRLRYVVVDEMHVFRGIFGSHVAHILRRLRRLAAHYRSDPVFVLASATIGNPAALATALTGLRVDLIEDDTSPRGERLVALWNPPEDEHNPDRRRSPLTATTDLFVDLVRSERHSIVFSRSRRSTELIYKWARDRLGPELGDRIAPYRGGYLADERRETERDLFGGKLLGVTATNALELGIDVGNLDAAVINTFPGTLSSFRQQIGRAGRSTEQSLAVLVGGEDALDQYFMRHPSQLFSRPSEPVVVNPDNPLVRTAHVACAAFEMPLRLEDREILGDGLEESVTELTTEGDLSLRDGKLHWTRRTRPASEISLRTSGGPRYTIFDVESGKAIGTIEQERAFSQAHPGAVYLHRGETYLVDDLDMGEREVLVHPERVNYYTQAHTEKLLEIRATDERDVLAGMEHYLGTVRVESLVVSYQRKTIGTGEVVGTFELDLPPSVFETQGFWLLIEPELIDRAGFPPSELPGTLHAAEHTMIAMLPLFAICDRWDLGGLSTTFHPQTMLPTIFVHEAYPGGAGISPVAFEEGGRLLQATLEALRTCPCADGCPSCVQSPKCGNFNNPLSKRGAASLLSAALESESVA